MRTLYGTAPEALLPEVEYSVAVRKGGAGLDKTMRLDSKNATPSDPPLGLGAVWEGRRPTAVLAASSGEKAQDPHISKASALARFCPGGRLNIHTGTELLCQRRAGYFAEAFPFVANSPVSGF